MRRRLLGALAAAACTLLAIGAGSATAITGGQPDGDAHPYVGMVVTYGGDVEPQLCSGTLISPTVFVTAGHCTIGQAHAEIWFGAGPFDPKNAPQPDAIGTPMTVDHYELITHDLGAVVLDRPYTGVTAGFPTPPSVNELDSLKTTRGAQDETFTTLGYGLEKGFPPAASWKDVANFRRMVATPHLIQIGGGQAGDFGMLLSSNASTGGVCDGDSGGPDLTAANVLAGITVGVNGFTCSGVGVALRLDRDWSLDWLHYLLDDYTS